VLGDLVEVLFEFFDGLGVKLESALPAVASAANQARGFEHAEVLGDCLAGEAGAVGELGDGVGLAITELDDQREAGLVAEGGEDGRVALGGREWTGSLGGQAHWR